MPGGLTGWDLAEKFVSQRPDLPVIYTSGYSSEFDKRSADLEDGINFIHKPFTQRRLMDTVHTRMGAEVA